MIEAILLQGERMTFDAIRQELHHLGDPAIAEHSSRFFKAGPGEYGEGDRFHGVRVPVVRKLVPACRGLTLEQVAQVLRSPWHEERLLALLCLVDRFARGDEAGRAETVGVYLEHTPWINNWDLVDCSAHKILGPWLEERPRDLLRQLARSESLWERRIAMMSTFHFIRRDEFEDTLELADLLLHDDHDLIHKIVGWMLREVGNRDRTVEEDFLRSRYRSMPRTLLRYAVEKFPEPLRKAYLAGTV
jgi:3-methyladenine DNA glycosylase AlkD